MSQFKPYSAYKDSGIEWFGEVPEHWVVLRVQNIARVIDPQPDHRAPALAEGDNGFPYIGIRDVNKDGSLNFDTARKVDEAAVLKQEASFSIESNDIVYCKVGTLGLPRKIRAHDRCALSATLVLIKADHVDSQFLLYCLEAAHTYAQVRFLASGSTRAALGIEQIRKFFQPFPTLSEQVAIATFLDHEIARIDALIEQQQRLNELLKEKRQTLISHTVTKGLDPTVPMKNSGVEWLGEVPAHWEVKRLKQIVLDSAGIQMGPFGGMLLDLLSFDAGYKVYGQENTISGDFTSGSRWISEARYLTLSNYHLEVGDIVLTRKGSLGNCRKISLLPQPGIIDSDTIRVRVLDSVIFSDYLEVLLHEAGYISVQLALAKRGAILSGLNTEIIASLVIAVPPRGEQERVLQHISSASSIFSQGISQCEHAVGLLRERRSALISAAVTGKIDVRNWQSPASEQPHVMEREALYG